MVPFGRRPTGNCCGAAIEAAGFPLTRRVCQRRPVHRPNTPLYGGKGGPAGPTRMLRTSYCARANIPAGAYAAWRYLDISHRPGTLRLLASRSAR